MEEKKGMKVIHLKIKDKKGVIENSRELLQESLDNNVDTMLVAFQRKDNGYFQVFTYSSARDKALLNMLVDVVKADLLDGVRDFVYEEHYDEEGE